MPPVYFASRWEGASLIAQKAIDDHTAEYLGNRGSARCIPTLVSMSVERLTDADAPAFMDDIPNIVLKRYIWSWHMMSYPVFCRALLRLSREGASQNDRLDLFKDPRIDDWILNNEKWLRDREDEDWRHGMVALSDSNIVFPGSVLMNDFTRVITRPDYLPGFDTLGQAREEYLRIQASSDSFKQMFESLSHGLLRNLDWSNIIVAGRIVLGTLVTVEQTHDSTPPATDRWGLSDVDVYIYGLSAADATSKLHHIFDVFRSNLPPQMRALVVRNSKTITFYANYPLRRIQIVLKLVKTPRDALLNFDLDICAMGWDGRDVWMLPRAARAIETGFNVFTMNLIHGHHLSERRATQPQRIFKYAQKGYGLRFLPTYLSSLRQPSNTEVSFLDVASIAEEARDWTLERYAFITAEVGSTGFDRSYLDTPGFPHALSSFTSLMHHVALWEMGQSSDDVAIEQHNWASTSYEDSPENIPRLQYNWDASFTVAKFSAHILTSNLEDIDRWLANDIGHRLQGRGIFCADKLNSAKRIASASNVKKLLLRENDIRLPLLLPVDFAIYANELVENALTDVGSERIRLLEPVDSGTTGGVSYSGMEANGRGLEGLFMWTIGPQVMWQQLDRRIDEVFEVLYAFRHANFRLDEDLQLARFTAALSRRKSIHNFDELAAFANWVAQSRNPQNLDHDSLQH